MTKRFSPFCILAILILKSTAGSDSPIVGLKQGMPKRLIADYGYWSRTNDPPYTSSQLPFSKLTQVCHAGVNINHDGINVPTDGFLEPELLTRAHSANVQVLLLFGGDGTVFSSVCADSGLRAKLVSNLTAFIKANDYDGVDVDWEFPAAQDKKNLVSLMSELREVLPKPRYLLSIDVPPWGGPGFDFDLLGKVIDFYNIMTYDYAGPWTDDGQLNSPIFPDPNNPDPQGSVMEAIDLLLTNYSVSPSQINMGTPFYGYFYENVPQLWAPCDNCSDDTVLSEPYAPFVKERVDREGWVYHVEPVSLVPYLLRADGKPGFITYDNPSSTYLRVWYSVWARGLGGTFMWSVDQDYDGHSQELLDAMYAATMNGK